jgi:hypothetical protein
MKLAARVLPVALLVAACGGDDDFQSGPQDVAGVYSVAVTNRQNDCPRDSWVEGETANGIELSVVQNGTAITGTVGGAVGLYLSVVTGSNSFTGTVDGNRISAKSFGTTPHTQGGCTLKIDMQLESTFGNNALSGTLTYLPNPEQGDCSAYEGCKGVQEFAGARPPK